MRQMVEICLAFIDLIKAELEQSRMAVVDLGIALGLVLAAVVFLVCAIWLLLYAVYLAFLSVVDPKWALVITALGAFVCAGILLRVAAYKGGR
jgi:hypothetical protein